MPRTGTRKTLLLLVAMIAFDRGQPRAQQMIVKSSDDPASSPQATPAQASQAPPPTTQAQTTTPAQTSTQNATPTQTEGPPPSIENTVEAAEPLPRRDLVHWNEYR